MPRTQTPDTRVAGFLGRVLDQDGTPVGTCFQVADGIAVTAAHVLEDLGAGEEGAAVQIDPLGGGDRREGRVRRIHPSHDLAVVALDEPLPDSVAGLSASNEVNQSTPVFVTGVGELDDPGHTYQFMQAQGTWAGATTQDAIPLGRISAKDVLRGMSGAPVLLESGTVVGVVSSRYNSGDGWLRDSVFVSRAEDLAPLLADLADIPLTRRSWHGVTDVTLTIGTDEVRLAAPDREVSAAHHGVRPDLLPSTVAEALQEVVAGAEKSWDGVRLGLRIAPELSALPWEALRVPGDSRPLALHPSVILYRQHKSEPIPKTPGPLRILIAISSPLSGGGAVLNYEQELRNVIAAVTSARPGTAAPRSASSTLPPPTRSTPPYAADPRTSCTSPPTASPASWS